MPEGLISKFLNATKGGLHEVAEQANRNIPSFKQRLRTLQESRERMQGILTGQQVDLQRMQEDGQVAEKHQEELVSDFKALKAANNGNPSKEQLDAAESNLRGIKEYRDHKPEFEQKIADQKALIAQTQSEVDGLGQEEMEMKSEIARAESAIASTRVSSAAASAANNAREAREASNSAGLKSFADEAERNSKIQSASLSRAIGAIASKPSGPSEADKLKLADLEKELMGS